ARKLLHFGSPGSRSTYYQCTSSPADDLLGDDRAGFHPPPSVEDVTLRQEGEGASHLLGRRHTYPLCVTNNSCLGEGNHVSLGEMFRLTPTSGGSTPIHANGWQPQ
ncbi:hypothetical protein BHM03_00030181, partial [Ensete ventricosum]